MFLEIDQTVDFIAFREAGYGRFAMLTECGLSSRLQVEFPEKQIVGSCTLCKYMKSNTLEGILRVLLKPQPKDEVLLDEDVRRRAQRCIDAMFEYVEKKAPAPGAPVVPAEMPS